ncbi:MAG: hypothetical protein IJA55_06980 [Clostridia bacterium]|nr:hypothetical protein [Clostridia bacterium]
MKDFQKNTAGMFAWCITHFAIDFTCIALLSSRFADSSAYSVILYAVLYNGFAFAFQFPIGMLADLFGIHGRLSAVGCFAVSLGVFITSPILMCTVIGFGNAMFHVGAAGQILNINKDKAANIGFFVAPGAIGVFLGSRFSRIDMLIWAASVALVFLGLLCVFHQRKNQSLPVSVTAKRIFCMIFLFLTVVLRAYVGNMLKYPFMKPIGPAFIFVLCVFMGKFIGGLCADRFGIFRFNCIVQPICVVLLTLSVIFPVTAFAAILLFNTTMAVCAYTVYRCFACYPGATFGLTTFALYIGTLPEILNIGVIDATAVSVSILGILSTAFLLAGIKCGEEAL